MALALARLATSGASRQRHLRRAERAQRGSLATEMERRDDPAALRDEPGRSGTARETIASPPPSPRRRRRRPLGHRAATGPRRSRAAPRTFAATTQPQEEVDDGEGYPVPLLAASTIDGVAPVDMGTRRISVDQPRRGRATTRWAPQSPRAREIPVETRGRTRSTDRTRAFLPDDPERRGRRRGRPRASHGPVVSGHHAHG